MMPATARDKMLAACEQAKKDLTWDNRAEIRFLNYGQMGDVHESIDIDTFAELIRPTVDRAIGCFYNCLREAGMSLTQIDCILMVGGSVNLRPFADRVAEEWDGKEVYPRDAEWSVARGAASLSVSPGSYVAAQTVGVVLCDGSLYPLLCEGDRISPASEGRNATFALVEDEQAANLVFADGEMHILGYLVVPAFGFFREKIAVSARIDEDLILRIEARSRNRSERTTTRWSYDRLRLDYQLPVTEFEVADGA